ncbi:hypothetical protein ACH5RR_020581 [Cinchona calisaya]|uniref:Small ribosomal subunit protein mS29 n=1 Tax=Cinchona calisaya TaxID=153742 RepID=A0ABD2ZEU2_9GENT
MRHALLIRQSFLDLRDNFRRIVDPPMYPTAKIPQTKKKIVLDGPRSCGKSIALAMLVHWARNEGWLVLYVPRGQEWTHGGFFYRNPGTGLWDTPVQATNVRLDFLKYNQTPLQELRCKIIDPIPLGEGAGVGWVKGADTMPVHAFRSMMHKDLMMVGAFSHSISVGKLRQDLPEVPPDARINFPRYRLDEAATVCHYYVRQQLVNRDAFSDENWKKIYYLANGNGTEIRQLMPFMR